MPTYLYKCPNKDCSEHDIEKTYRKKMSEPDPFCGQCIYTKMVQVFKKATNFSLKGSDWTGSNITGKIKR